MRVSSTSVGYGLMFVLSASCETSAGPSSSSQLDAATSSHTFDGSGRSPAADLRVAVTLPPGGRSTLSLQTARYAECKLHGEHDTEHFLEIGADDEGIARIEFSQADPLTQDVMFVLDCIDEQGGAISHTIDVKIEPGAVSQRAAPRTRVGKPTLPVLEGDPLSYTPGELRLKGFPPRPDPHGAPSAYARWLQLTTSAPTITKSHPIPRTSHRSTTYATTPNWSGVVIESPANAYGLVSGELLVPGVNVSVGTFPASSALWVGLGGYNTLNLLQAGTEQDNNNYLGVRTAGYYAWTEWVPAESQVREPTIPVDPNDEIYVWVWTDTYNQYGITAGGPDAGAAQRTDFTQLQSWLSPTVTGEYVLPMMGDVNGDGLSDMVVFSASTISSAVSTASSFSSPTSTPGSFAGPSGTLMGDVNGDGFDDAVAFNNDPNNGLVEGPTLVSLSNGSGFGSAQQWQASPFGGTWLTLLGDVDGDGRADAVAFNTSNIQVALSSGTSFESATTCSTYFPSGTAQFLLGDVNGDGMADVVVYQGAETSVMLSNGPTGTCFGSPQTWSTVAFNTDLSYYPYVGPPPGAGTPGGTVTLADVNADGRADIVAFDRTYTYVALSTGSSFAHPQLWLEAAIGSATPTQAFAPQMGGSYMGPSTSVSADVNGDGFADAVSFGSTVASVGLTGATAWSSGNVGLIYFWNITQNVVTEVVNYSTASTNLTNNSVSQAEWILEATQVNGSVAPLADYGTAQISNCGATDFTGMVHNLISDSVNVITIQKNNVTESTPTVVSPTTVSFTWNAN